MNDGPSTCRAFLDASADLAGVPDEALPQAFTAHMNGCVRCRDHHAADRRAWRALAGVFADVGASDEFLQLDEPRSQPTTPRRTWRLRAAAAVAACLIGVTSWFVAHRPNESPESGAFADVPLRRVLEFGSATFVTDGRPLLVATPLGTLRAADASFEVTVSHPGEPRFGAEHMTRTQSIVAVSVAVTAGVIWWIASDGREARLAAPDVLRREAVIETTSAPPPASADRRPDGAQVTVKPFVSGQDEETRPVTAGDSRPTCPIRVEDDEGNAVVGATVVIFRRGEVLGSERTNEGGLARLPSVGGDTDALVANAGTPPFLGTVHLDANGSTLRLPAGATVGGSFVVDGKPPTSAIKFTLAPDHPFAATASLPATVRAFVEKQSLEMASVHSSSTADGRFRVGGLPADWSGSLELDAQFTFEEGSGTSSTTRLLSPSGTLTLNIKHTPGITFRVVDAGTRTPLPFARATTSFLSQSSVTTGARTADEHGRVTIYLPSPTLRSVDMTISAADGRGARAVKVFENLTKWQDLGDLEIARSRQVAFVVRDTERRPVAGAVASIGENVTSKSAPTDQDGHGTMALSVGDVHMNVAALGYATARVAIPSEADAPIEVTLDTSNVLVVSVHDAAGAVPPGVQIRIGLSGKTYKDGSDFPDSAQIAAGASGVASGMSDGSHTVLLMNPDAKGTVQLSNLQTASKFSVSAVDAIGGRLDSTEVVVPERGTHTVTLTVTQKPRIVRGWVRDEAGRPLANASIMIFTEPSLATRSESAADGRFELDRIYSDAASVRVEKAGYVPLDRKDWRVPIGDEETTFVMKAGRDVVLSVLDARGRPQAGVGVSVTVDDPDPAAGGAGSFPFGETSESGAFDFKNLPLGAVTFHADYAGRSFSLKHQTAGPVAKLSVPCAGSVEVRWEFAMPDESFNYLILTPVGSEGAPVRTYLAAKALASKSTRLRAVLPGRYTVTTESEPVSHDKARRPVSAPQTIDVSADEVVRVTLVQ